MSRCSKTIGLVSHALCALFFLAFLANTSYAVGLVATDSAIVTATVPEQSFNPPMLIDPSNNSITSNPKEPFSWRRPSPLPVTPLDHYDFFLDGNLFAQGISDGITSSEFYFYKVYRDGDIFHLEVKSNMSDGYHQWKVIAYNETGLSAESETWTFYVDSTNPNIKLISADNNTLNWDTAHPETIPPVDQRYIYITQNPLLTGTVEPYANLQFTLLCPIDVTNCDATTETYNYPSGSWQHRFYNLLPNKTYTVYLSSSDAAGNHIFFPPFYLIFLSGGIGSPTPSIPPVITITPPPVPTIALPSPTGIPIPPTLTQIFIPAEFIPVPPVIPTPPPSVTPPAPKPKFNFLPYIILLLVFGLPLHLAMSQFGTNTKTDVTHLFIFTLLFPFLGRKKHQTIPFTTIIFYDPKITYKTWQIVVSDINGQYGLNKDQPKDFFIKCYSFKRIFNPSIISSEKHAIQCLNPIPEDHENTLQRLQNTSFRWRVVPLIAAILTSSIALFLNPTYFLVIYLYLSLQAAFSEYYYPQLSK